MCLIIMICRRRTGRASSQETFRTAISSVVDDFAVDISIIFRVLMFVLLRLGQVPVLIGVRCIVRVIPKVCYRIVVSPIT